MLSTYHVFSDFKIDMLCVVIDPTHRLNGQLCYVSGFSSSRDRIFILDVLLSELESAPPNGFAACLRPDQLRIV